MRLKDAAVEIRKSRFPEPVKSVCLNLTDWMARSEPAQLAFLTPSQLAGVAGDKVDSTLLMTSLTALTSSSFAILEVGGYVLDEAGSIVEIDDETLFSALEFDVFVHPLSGEKLERARDIVHVFYALREGIAL